MPLADKALACMAFEIHPYPINPDDRRGYERQSIRDPRVEY